MRLTEQFTYFGVLNYGLRFSSTFVYSPSGIVKFRYVVLPLPTTIVPATYIPLWNIRILSQAISARVSSAETIGITNAAVTAATMSDTVLFNDLMVFTHCFYFISLSHYIKILIGFQHSFYKDLFDFYHYLLNRKNYDKII